MKLSPFPPPHRHWEKRVLYAYLRMMGSSQVAASRAVGRSVRAVQLWEDDLESYQQAREDARKRWLVELTDAARHTLLKTIKDGTNGLLALQVLERMDDDLAPAKQRIEVEGKGLAALLDEARQQPLASTLALPMPPMAQA